MGVSKDVDYGVITPFSYDKLCPKKAFPPPLPPPLSQRPSPATQGQLYASGPNPTHSSNHHSATSLIRVHDIPHQGIKTMQSGFASVSQATSGCKGHQAPAWHLPGLWWGLAWGRLEGRSLHGAQNPAPGLRPSEPAPPPR